MMGIEHERIHLETSSVLIRQHALEHVRPHSAWEPCRKSGKAPQNQLINVPAGIVNVGKSKTDPSYGWDNEYGRHIAEVPAFQAGKYLVSNQEFLDIRSSKWLPYGKLLGRRRSRLATSYPCGIPYFLDQAW